MSSLIPLNFYETLEKNPYSDYPCAKHMLNAANVDLENNTVIDQIGNVVADAGNIVAIGGSENIKVNMNSNTPHLANISGSWEAPEDKSILMFSLAAIGAASGVINIGNPISTIGGIQQAAALTRARVGSSTANGEATGVVFGGNEEFHAVSFVPSTSVKAYRLENNGAYDDDNGTEDTISIPASNALEDVSTFLNVNDWYATLVLYFDTLPSANMIEEAMRWMLPLWNRGIFVIYPPLRKFL